MFGAYLDDRSRVLAPPTVIRHGESLEVFRRYLRTLQPEGILPASSLTRQTLASFWTWLRTTKQKYKPLAVATANRRVQHVELAWRWLSDSDAYGEQVPRPRRLEVPTPTPKMVISPTWAEMDRCIAAAEGPAKKLATVLRFTGLRVQQAMMLRWDDVDMEAGTLRIRPELGKTASERRGRVVPLSPHLVAELAGWGKREGWLLPCNRVAGPRERVARPRDMARAWARAQVREEAWGNGGNPDAHGDPHHAFRGGFQSELTAAGVASEILDHLVGHTPRSVRGRHCLDPAFLDLRSAVDKIPPLAHAAPPQGGAQAPPSLGRRARRRVAVRPDFY